MIFHRSNVLAKGRIMDVLDEFARGKADANDLQYAVRSADLPVDTDGLAVQVVKLARVSVPHAKRLVEVVPDVSLRLGYAILVALALWPFRMIGRVFRLGMPGG